MKQLIACCGLDCESCDARIATVTNNNELREKTAQKWNELNGISEITAEMINCMGCRTEGAKTVFCGDMCEIRKCVNEKGINTCGDCKDFDGCKMVSAIFEHSPDAKENLQLIMKIRHITKNKKQFFDLLLLGDESESMIDLYLEKGDLFALYDDDLKGVCVITEEDSMTCELKNIAVYEQYQGQGYGTALIRFVTEHYKGKYDNMILGTGDIPSILSFYERCGFEPSHRIKNFFTDNYDHPMFEDGIQLIDMVYLKKSL